MKVSVEISNPLFEEARRVAAERGVSMQSLVELGLRQILAQEESKRESFQLRDARVQGHGLQPDFSSASWSDIRNAIEHQVWRR